MRGEAGKFEHLALELFRLQYDHVPAYRVFCESQGAHPRSVADWAQIPAVPTNAFKDLEFTSIAPGHRSAVFCSSGTTEQRPSRHFHHEQSLAVYESSLLAWTSEHLPLEGANLIFLTPDPKQAPRSSLVRMFAAIGHCHAVRRATFVGTLAPDGAWEVNDNHTFALLKACEAAREPVGVLGTAFNFVHLIDALDELRFSLAPDSWMLETGGYKGRSRSMPRTELHSLLSAKFGVAPDRIITEYGMCELSSQAYDTSLVHPRQNDRVFRFPPWARTLIVSPETGREVCAGEIGLLRVYDLANVYSVMAIETQDLSRAGADFELIGRAEAVEPRGCSLMTL
jgi:hypothetical protein